MYDSFKIRSDEEMKHLTKHNWNVISQQGNSCVRKYELDKVREVYGRKQRSQAFLFYHNNKPSFILHTWHRWK